MQTTLKAISLWQPWASLMVAGYKRIETRNWAPHNLRSGQLIAIHAAKRWPPDDDCDAMLEDPFFRRYLTLAERRGLWNPQHPPLGGVVGVARFLGAFPTERLRNTITQTERAFGNYQPGRYGWVFSEARPLAIIPERGQQGLFDWQALRPDEMRSLYQEPEANQPRPGTRMAELLLELAEELNHPTARVSAGAELETPPLAASAETTAETTAQPQQPHTRVVHCRREAYDVYVGRAVKRYPDLRPLGWGNPYSDGLDTAEGRLSAIDRYRAWVLDQPRLLARLPELRGKRLGCWCAPLGGLPGNLHGSVCHGEVLAALAENWCARCGSLETPEHVREHMNGHEATLPATAASAFAAEAHRLLDAWRRGDMPDLEDIG